MPGRDGTGPMGRGIMSGRGLGLCITTRDVRYGVGLGHGFGLGLGSGCRRNLGPNFIADAAGTKTQKELLIEQKELLKNRLDRISQQLEDFTEANK